MYEAIAKHHFVPMARAVGETEAGATERMRELLQKTFANLPIDPDRQAGFVEEVMQTVVTKEIEE